MMMEPKSKIAFQSKRDSILLTFLISTALLLFIFFFKFTPTIEERTPPLSIQFSDEITTEHLRMPSEESIAPKPEEKPIHNVAAKAVEDSAILSKNAPIQVGKDSLSATQDKMKLQPIEPKKINQITRKKTQSDTAKIPQKLSAKNKKRKSTKSTNKLEKNKKISEPSTLKAHEKISTKKSISKEKEKVKTKKKPTDKIKEKKDKTDRK